MAVDSSPMVIDLFAGGGFLSHAFAAEGFRITQAIELDRYAAQTAHMNLGPVVSQADVTATAPEGRCEVLVAGPPCQGFSTLGKRDPYDPRNALSLAILPWVEKLRPQAVVVENVATFLDSPIARRLRRQLVRHGYTVSSSTLDAIDYGVPQRRKRCFIIAAAAEPDIRPLKRPFARTVAEAWDGLASRPTGTNWHCAPEPSPIALARMRVIPEGGDRRDVMRRAPHLTPPSWWRLRCQVTDSWGRLRWLGPSNTLRTCIQNASKGRYIHPDQDRVISIREAARLHSIGDKWSFAGYPIHAARQIGNSVPPWLGRAIARSLFKMLN